MKEEIVKGRGRWASFAGVLGFIVSLGLLRILVTTHEPQNLAATDNRLIAKVMLCVTLAAVSSIASFVLAARNIAQGDWLPLAWLAALVLGWYAFVDFWLLPLLRTAL